MCYSVLVIVLCITGYITPLVSIDLIQSLLGHLSKDEAAKHRREEVTSDGFHGRDRLEFEEAYEVGETCFFCMKHIMTMS